MMRVETVMKTNKVETNEASTLIDERIRDLADWRGETLAHVRKIIRQADPQVIEEWKSVSYTHLTLPTNREV